MLARPPAEVIAFARRKSAFESVHSMSREVDPVRRSGTCADKEFSASRGEAPQQVAHYDREAL
jgi:hypothetical protein